MPVVEAEFHLLQVQEEVHPRQAVVAAELGLRVAPEVLNSVNVLALALREVRPVVDAVVPVPISNEAVVAGERVGVNRTPRRNALADNLPERPAGYVRDGGRVHLPVPLQDAENNDFPCGCPTPETFPVATEVRLVHLVLTVPQRCFTLGHTGNPLADCRVQTIRCVAVNVKLTGSLRCWHF